MKNKILKKIKKHAWLKIKKYVKLYLVNKSPGNK